MPRRCRGSEKLAAVQVVPTNALLENTVRLESRVVYEEMSSGTVDSERRLPASERGGDRPRESLSS